MLTAFQFQHRCASLPLSQETCQVLLELWASPPVRRVESRARSLDVLFTLIAEGHLYVDLDAMPLIE